MAEAKALFLAYDPASEFETPEGRVLIARSTADPFVIAARIAFARRVGPVISHASDAEDYLRGRSVRVRKFDLAGASRFDPDAYLGNSEVDVDLLRPDMELTVVRGEREYLAVTAPLTMVQDWTKRRPRRRPFFHPSAMFPKLSRALVNLSRVKAGETFLDPFCGTGSLPIEAALVGAKVAALDKDRKMARGSLGNMKSLGQEWLGVMRGDAFFPPLARVDAIATDVPYGRASSTLGADRDEVVGLALSSMARLLPAGARAVLMHAKTGAQMVAGDFEVEEEHDLYVHKLLTRTISVLRRR